MESSLPDDLYGDEQVARLYRLADRMRSTGDEQRGAEIEELAETLDRTESTVKASCDEYSDRLAIEETVRDVENTARSIIDETRGAIERSDLIGNTGRAERDDE